MVDAGGRLKVHHVVLERNFNDLMFLSRRKRSVARRLSTGLARTVLVQASIEPLIGKYHAAFAGSHVLVA